MVIIRICVQTRPRNGGIIPLEELVERIQKSGSKCRDKASIEDVKRAIKKLSVLGNGFRIIELASSSYVVSVPTEMSNDQQMLIEVCSEHGRASASLLKEERGWDELRFAQAVSLLLQEELIWQDDNNGRGTIAC